MAKKLPALTTDAEAIEFIENADLSQHELSGFIPCAEFFARVDAERKLTPITIRLPVSVVEKFKARAKATGVPYQRLMRATLETAKRGQSQAISEPQAFRRGSSQVCLSPFTPCEALDSNGWRLRRRRTAYTIR
jgi:predicted DNA binding CopG/RHH family protein